MKYSAIANNKLKDKRILYDIRRQMVEYYMKINSYRSTAEKFGVNLKTVIKWVKRYKEKGLEGLKDIKRTPKKIHNKVSEEIEKLVIELRKQTGYGARRLKYEFELKISVGPINRILKQNGLIESCQENCV